MTRAIAIAAMVLAGCTESLGKLRINELSAANVANCADVFGEADDWIELYNVTSSLIDLGGYHVFNTGTPADVGVIPDGVTIPPRGYLLLWADDKQQGLDHLAFKLSSGGDSVTLTAPNGEVIDEISWASADPNISYARIPDVVGDFERCSKPTCGASNGNQCD